MVKVRESTVSQFSRTQKIVSLRYTKAEYVATEKGVNESMLVRNVLEFMVYYIEPGPVKVLKDNEGSIQLAKHPLSSARIKHIDVR